jgi:hypothetical protein
MKRTNMLTKALRSIKQAVLPKTVRYSAKVQCTYGEYEQLRLLDSHGVDLLDYSAATYQGGCIVVERKTKLYAETTQAYIENDLAILSVIK